MRRAAKVDRNQAEIVAALRAMGATVQPLHAVGEGCPDLLVGWRGRNVLIEVKDGAKPPSARKLTSAQVDWHGGWKGQIDVAATIEQAIAVMTGRICVSCRDTLDGPPGDGCASMTAHIT